MTVIDITVFFAITGPDVMCGTIFLISSILSLVFYGATTQQRNIHTLMSVTQTSLVCDLKSGPAEVVGIANRLEHRRGFWVHAQVLQRALGRVALHIGLPHEQVHLQGLGLRRQ